MQTQAGRDQKTLDIFTSVLVFVGVVVLGGVLLALAHHTVGLADGVVDTGYWVLVGVGTVLALRYLAQRR